ncbi:hypothetical protein TNCT_247551 [Trichonephila clavata]|uniref:Uncharacterized protein n=1 Tax=Trichonephila clavata TaxID=2740835 RepID=A0A8X6J1P4_TRICU|nr:hypothetical protein TNCT_247551 [Trichonephila clavata]
MARRRGLVHIEKSSLVSALDRVWQHFMGVSPLSSFEESSGGSTWHVRKVYEFGVWRGPRWNWNKSVLPKIMMTTKKDIILLPNMEKNISSLAPSNTLSWAERVENATPSLSPGTSLCPDGGQIPSTPPTVEQQLFLTTWFFIIKKMTTIF